MKMIGQINNYNWDKIKDFLWLRPVSHIMEN